MSTARTVPETYDLDDDDARETLQSVSPSRLLKEGFTRFRHADGFSHARALAFQVVLTLVPGVIVAAGLTAVVGNRDLSDALVSTMESLAPGPAADVFRSAVEEGSANSRTSAGARALVFGGLAMVFSAMGAFGQLERGTNRIYGVERDRPSFSKYARALALAVSAGLLLALAFVTLAIGSNVADAIDDGTAADVWQLARWPLGVLFLVGAYSLIFRFSPRRRQPNMSWLAFGASFGVALTVLVTLALALYLGASSDFGETYGPLAGFMGILLWAYLTSLALLLGVAFAAQLEDARAEQAATRRTTPTFVSPQVAVG